MAAVETVIEFEAADVRRWANENGKTVGTRGRFSDELLIAYREAGSPTYEREAKDTTRVAAEPREYVKVEFPEGQTLTRRQYAASLGLAAVDARGRLSKTATDAIARAASEGYVFAEPAAFIAKPKKVSLRHPDRHANKVDTSLSPLPKYDAANVKQWAAQNDKNVPARGRLSHALVREWVDAGSPIVTPQAALTRFEQTNPKPNLNGESSVVTEARERHSKLLAAPASNELSEIRRTDKTAFVLTKNPGEADYMAPVLIAFQKCSRCNNGIQFCGCNDGPFPPKYVTAVSPVKFSRDAFDKVSV